MSGKYAIEALLRPPVELYSALSLGGVSLIALKAPSFLMMTPEVAYLCASIVGARGLQRLYQGLRVYAYQKGLKKLPLFKMASTQIPRKRHYLYLGHGFAWDQRHSQRLADSERPEARRFKEPSLIYKSVRVLESGLDRTRILKCVADITRYQSSLNPLAPYPPVGGNSAIHAVGMYEGERKVFMNLADRVGHTLVLGTTRVGKTRLAELMVSQDIRRGDVVIVFDPKGDADLFRRMYSEADKARRLDDFYFFHLGYPEISARYNPVGSFSRVTEVASRISGNLPGEGQSAAFREFVWRYVNVIAKACTALGIIVDYEKIKYYGEDLEPLVRDYMKYLVTNGDNPDAERDVEQYKRYFEAGEQGFKIPRHMKERDLTTMALVKYVKDHDIADYVAHSLIKTYEYDRVHFDKLVSSLLPLMEKLTTGKCAELVSPDYLDVNDDRPIFDWSTVIRTKSIVYVGLDALTDPEVSSAIGNAMFADLTSYSGKTYKHGINQGLPVSNHEKPKVNIHADEFNELIGDEFIPMLNKAGGAGFQVTAYTQTWSDVEARLQDKAKAGQVAGNFNTLLMLRVRELATAEMLTKQLKDVEINQLTTVSAATDSSDITSDTHFTSKTEQRISSQRVPLIQAGDITQLPKGQCFALLDGGKPFKLRLPLPDERDFINVPNEFAQIVQDMKGRYTTSDDWYRFTPTWTQGAA